MLTVFQSIESVMKFQVQEYEIGKRHLAKMMGEKSENFPQEYVDVC